MNCAEVLDRLDTWLDRELPPDEAAEVARHLETCATCNALVANRTAVRDRLRHAARSVQPQPQLAARIHARIASDRPDHQARWGFLAAAAMVLLTLGTYSSWKSGHLRMTPESRANYIASLVPEVAPLMRIGLQQHVHCAVFRSYPAQYPTLPELAASLGPQYSGLVPVMQAHVPAGFHVVMAHKCDYNGRQYIHVVAREGGNLISLLITKRDWGEAFEKDLRAVAAEAGTPVYSSVVPRFSIAGFETPQYLVYLVSDLNQGANLSILESMTQTLRTALS